MHCRENCLANTEDTKNGAESENLTSRVTELSFIRKLIDFFIFIKQEADFLRLEYDLENNANLDEEALEVYQKKKAKLFEELNKWDNIRFDHEPNTCWCLDEDRDEFSKVKCRTSGITNFCVSVVLNIQMFLLKCRQIINKFWHS